ncbi:hypothetical protein BJX63DRAFT_407674 [Aspergillus granulosus]|uniref:Uncharacterized protein n=1 Tax=Aspergillus granulosus TaxID=176169 RepID=A0ABR4H059_9EURO
MPATRDLDRRGDDVIVYISSTLKRIYYETSIHYSVIDHRSSVRLGHHSFRFLPRRNHTVLCSDSPEWVCTVLRYGVISESDLNLLVLSLIVTYLSPVYIFSAVIHILPPPSQE